MIKPEDLRIGNWVNHHGEIITVDGIDDIDVFNKKCGEIPLHSILPIPLTEKILLDCGFDQISDTNIYVISMHKIGINKLKSLAVYIDENSYTAAIVDYYTGVEKTDLLHMDYQHLHELQNLFYSLTKTELIIKL